MLMSHIGQIVLREGVWVVDTVVLHVVILTRMHLILMSHMG